MNALPLQFLALILAGWVKRARQDVIGCFQAKRTERGRVVQTESRAHFQVA